MKGKSYLLVGLVVGTALGWALGFLRLPHLEKNVSFLLGFAAALVFVSLVLLLMMVWNRKLLSGLRGPNTATGDTPNPRAFTFLWILPAGVFVLGSLVGGLFLYRQNEDLKRQVQTRDQKMQEMAAIAASLKKNNLEPLMHNLLEDVGEALQRNPGKPLQDTTIARIAALSFTFKPYPSFEKGNLSEKAYSPERGQLLQALVLMPMDTGSFARIKRKTTFAGADLRGADLKGLDLSGINLRGAHLKNADLGGANLQSADLREANLWGANLNRADLGRADLRRADLNWAQLNASALPLANLDGAILTNAQLGKADLHGATFQWAQAGSALFNEATLTHVNFTGTNLSKANLSMANLRGADLRRANLTEATLGGASLDNTLVDDQWSGKLKVWRPMGAREIQEMYSVANDTADAKKQPLYRLKKR